jgi:hypothetical protein
MADASRAPGLNTHPSGNDFANLAIFSNCVGEKLPFAGGYTEETQGSDSCANPEFSRKGRLMKRFIPKTICVVAILSLLLAGATSVEASIQYWASGTLSPGTGNLVVFGTNWANAQLTWRLSYDSGTSGDVSDDVWIYEYVFDNNTRVDGSAASALSHMTIEVSDNFVLADDLVIGGTTSFEGLGPDPTSPLGEDGNVNDGLEWALKFDAGTSEFTAVVTSTRNPMWGDIYLKDGKQDGGTIEVQGWNSGYFAADPDLVTYPITQNMTVAPGWGWVAVPDTEQIQPPAVPEPSALAIWGLGLAAVAFYRRRRA